MESVKIVIASLRTYDGVVEDSLILGYDQGRPETFGCS